MSKVTPIVSLPPSPSPSSLLSLFKTAETTTYYLAFIASSDPATNQPWCPDVRGALPTLMSALADSGKSFGYVEVGSKQGWSSPSNPFRTNFGITHIPTLVKYRLSTSSSDSMSTSRNNIQSEQVVEVGRLIESECKNAEKVKEFMNTDELE